MLPGFMKKTVYHNITNFTLIAKPCLNGCGIVRIYLKVQNTHSERIIGEGNNSELERYAGLIYEYLEGKNRNLSDIKICPDKFSRFRLRVTKAAMTIPYGQTISYGELACSAGYPGAARSAASVMKNNPFPLVVPCHRVIRTNGSVGGFGGKTKGKLVALKRRLLRLENII